MKKFGFVILSMLALFGTIIPFAVANAETVLPLDHVVISPGAATVAVNGTQQFNAVGQDTANATVSNVTYSWAVVAGGGIVDGNGLFSAGNTTGNSTVQVTAAQNETIKTANASVIVVVPGPLDHVLVSPNSVTLLIGGTQQYAAIGQDAANVTIPGLTFSWIVVASGGSINGTGFFTAGNTTATFNNTVQATAVKDGITKTGNATVTVAIGPLGHVVISPNNVTLTVNGTQQFTAIVQDAANVTIPGLVYTWEVVAGGGTINGTGFFTAGNITGNFTNTIKVIVVQGGVTKTAYATVKVKAAAGDEDNDEGDEPKGWSHGNKTGWGNEKTPPGWSHGEKKGWDDGDTPPGLAKDKKSGK